MAAEGRLRQKPLVRSRHGETVLCRDVDEDEREDSQADCWDGRGDGRSTRPRRYSAAASSSENRETDDPQLAKGIAAKSREMTLFNPGRPWLELLKAGGCCLSAPPEKARRYAA